MASETGRKRLPPYISYRTFRNFIEGLQHGVPARIDRSYWGDRYSGSNGTQLVSALRFLGLIDHTNAPSPRLRQLASSRDTQRSDVLRQICTDAYLFLLGSSFEPQQATYAQLEELFHSVYQITDDVARKCIKFFIEISIEAGIGLSPFILKRSRTIRSAGGTKKVTRKSANRTNQNVAVPQKITEIPRGSESWGEMLLVKFPTFDPAWPNEVKIKWFEGFEELLKMGLTPGLVK